MTADQPTLRRHQSLVVAAALESQERSPIVLVAPPGTGATSAITEVCRRIVRDDASVRILIGTDSPPQATKVRRRIDDAVGPQTATLFEARSFRLLLDRDVSEWGPGIYVAARPVLRRPDIADLFGSLAWTAVISVGLLERRSDDISWLLELPASRVRLFVERVWSPEQASSLDEARIHSWRALTRAELGLHPKRQFLTWRFRRDQLELEILRELERARDSAPGQAQRYVAHVLIQAASSSPLAIEGCLLRLRTRRAEPVLASTSEGEHDELVSHAAPAAPPLLSASELETLLTRLDAVDSDRKLAAAIRGVHSEFSAGAERIVVLCQFVDTASYLRDALEEAISEPHIRFTRISGAIPPAEREQAIQAWEKSRSVLVCTIGSVAAADLGAADIAVLYDIPTSASQLEQAWGRVDRIGRATLPRLALVLPEDEHMTRFEAEMAAQLESAASP